MTDIQAYVEYKKYMKFQHCRPDYSKAVEKSISLAHKYIHGKNIVVADFCCGTANNTKLFAEANKGIKKAILIDINKGLLEIAGKSKISANSLEIINKDVIKAPLKKESDIVLSIFAYHHVPDNKKIKYIEQIKKTLKKGGVVILAEIYFNNRKQCLQYYDVLFSKIPKSSRIPGLKTFLQQTAGSKDFEFKVSKKYADKQFKESGFKLLEEVKIWPKDDSEIGMFVQAYKL